MRALRTPSTDAERAWRYYLAASRHADVGDTFGESIRVQVADEFAHRARRGTSSLHTRKVER